MDNIICSICNSEYDETIKIPLILSKCGHTYCQICLLNLINDNSLICPNDNTLYQDVKDINSYEYILINQSAMKLLKKNKDQEM